MSIDAALKLFHGGKPEVALEVLLSDWRKSRAPELAEAVAFVGAAVDATRERLPSKRDERLTAWKKRAAAKSSADVGVLLDALDGFLAEQAEPLIKLLQSFPADPRLVDGLLALADSPPTGMRGRKADPFWRAVFKTVNLVGDPRSVERLNALRAKWQSDEQERSGIHWADSSAVLLAAYLSVKQKAPPKAKKLGAKEKALLGGLKRQAPAGDVSSLTTQVYSRPADDDVRRVLADALLEAGDVRGELITLQLLPSLDATQRKRAKQLLDQHARKWLGVLEPAILKSGLVYRRGFPAVAKLSTNQRSVVDKVMGRPEWNTFEELDLESWPSDSRKAFLSQPLLGLRYAYVLENPSDLPDRALDWEGVSFRFIDKAHVAQLSALSTLPKLKWLEFLHTSNGHGGNIEAYGAFWRSSIARRLETIRGVPFLDWFKNAPENVVRLEDPYCAGERTANGLVVTINWDFPQSINGFKSPLAEVKKHLHAVTITTKGAVDAADKKQLERLSGCPIEWRVRGAG